MDFHSLAQHPIRPDQPTGSDARYEPEFEQLQREIDKLSIPSTSSAIDWHVVAELANSILSKKSKDLLVAGYLAVSQIHINQTRGLADGLTIMHDLMAQYWENLFPAVKRMRGRLAAIAWWIEKSGAALERFTPQPVEADKLNEMDTTLRRIDVLLKQHLPTPPLLRPIQRFVEKIPSSNPKLQPAGTTSVNNHQQAEFRSQTKPAEKAFLPAAEISKTETLANEQDAQKTINSILQEILRVALFLLEKNPGNPLIYRYRRIALWSKVPTSPPASHGQTQIQPPAPQIRQSLDDLRNSGNWHVLLASAEQRLSQFIFWFDLNRFVAESLAGLGDDYQAAQEAVCLETAFFLYRLPGLDSLAFSDGTPFADPETQNWLESIKLSKGEDLNNLVLPKDAGEDKNQKIMIEKTIANALNLAKKKKLVEAINSLQAELRSCCSKKEALMWRLALCQVLIGCKRTDMALPHLDLILKDIDEHHLDTWDPELALKGLKVVWTGFNKHTDRATKNNADAVLNRIAELDAVEALQLAK